MSVLFCSCKHRKTPPRNYFAGHNVNSTAEIVRDRDTKEALLKIETKGRWYLYGGLSVERIDFSKPLLEVYGSGEFRIPVPDSVRSYFQLVTYSGKGLMAERCLPMSGGFNFRDLGGLRNSSGHYVKWGKILRADDLNNLTDRDVTYLASVPLASVVDLRSDEEVLTAPNRYLGPEVECYNYPILPGNLREVAADLSTLDPADIDSLMISMNEQLVTDPASIACYKELFALLQDESKVPLVFHCSAGKDRTGFGAALVLLALDVDEETVFENYMESNVCLADKYSDFAEEYPELKDLYRVKPEYLGAALDAIREKYGTVEKYLTDVLEVDIERFRSMYLYQWNGNR